MNTRTPFSIHWILLLAFFGWAGVQAQTIVNTETLLAQVDSGWAATFGVVGDLSFGNSRVTDLSTDGSVGYTSGEMTYRLAASWARLAEDGNAIQENRFAQLRVNREFGDSRWKAFAVVQTASNNATSTTTDATRSSHGCVASAPCGTPETNG